MTGELEHFGLVHFDFSSQKIFDYRGVLVILDFQMAKNLQDNEHPAK